MSINFFRPPEIKALTALLGGLSLAENMVQNNDKDCFS